MDASLVFVRSDGKTQEVPLSPKRYVIGRQSGCELRVAEAAVSREHAELVFDGDSIALRDLGSSNGTYVNREKIDQLRLSAGDVVCIGSMAIVVRIDGAPSEVDVNEARLAVDAMEGSSAPVDAPLADAARDPNETSGSGLLDDLDLGSSDGSSVVDFDFDFRDDDEDDQPAL